MFDFLLLLFIASIAGALGARIAGRDKPLGCLASIALGFIGALLGRWAVSKFDLPVMWTVRDFPVVWSVVGAAVFVATINLVGGRR